MKHVSFLPDIHEQFSDWYNEVITLAKLADHSPVKGCITILPYGYGIWELMQKELDTQIKKMGALNMAFPLLIPLHLLSKEKEHVEGFAPEVAMVTIAGGEELEEPLVIRPTSEVIIHSYFKKWIHSWRDLPIKVNQWCSVLRWEKRPRPFIRTTEFWWQEGHTAHETLEEAKKQVFDAIHIYKHFVEDFLCIPVFLGKKPDHERFAGAEETWTIEGMMQDGKAVQMGTAHLLSQGFSTSIGIEFQGRDQQNYAPFLTSWGVTTRLIGTLIMVHGDQKGLVLPPKIAPVQFAIVPIVKSHGSENTQIEDLSVRILGIMNSLGFRATLFGDQSQKPGARFSETEVKGIPFRIEIGARDFLQEKVTLFSRNSGNKELVDVSLFEDSQHCHSFFSSAISKVQHELFQAAVEKRNSRTISMPAFRDFVSYSEEINKNMFLLSYWCGKDFEKIKEAGHTVRCVFSVGASDVFIKKPLIQTCCLHHSCEADGLSLALIARSY